ncbi:MAG TPA: MCE family protein [Candidatus Dormibacteraeota bacterium]|jgi:phospholipid/cholesterol/gamma-HCH transport system substrate-binding protein|nr:MCE family protein [Candidatus Dormibacteraeota bacterium]
MRIVSGNRYLAGVVLIAVIAIVIVVAVSINLSFGLPLNLSLGLPPSQDYTLRAVFTDANGLTKGADVEVAGNQVGQVTGISLDDGKALVSMRIERKYAPLHSGTIAQIDYSTLLAEKFIELMPAAGTPTLSDGATIPSTETMTSVDFDQVLSGLDPQTRQQVQVLVQQLGGGVAGRQDAINELLQQLAGLSGESQPTLDTLRQNDPQLASIVSNLAIAGGVLAQSHKQLGDLVGNVAVVSETLNQNDASLDSLLPHLASTSNDLDQTLNGNQGNLRDTITELDPFLGQLNTQLTTTYPDLQGSQTTLQQSFDYLTPYIVSAISQQDANGNYLRQFVVVDLCDDSLSQTVTKYNKSQASCLVPAVTGVASSLTTGGATAPPSGAASGPGSGSPSSCDTPLPTPSAAPCPKASPTPTPSPCSPAPTPTPTPKPAPTPTPTGCSATGSGGLLGEVGSILGGLLGG